MIGIGDDVIISGKVIEVVINTEGERWLLISLNEENQMVYLKEKDIKSYRPYRPIPESDERRGQ